MFRRKTDLVYSTLQQVQRRMTNQTESNQSNSASRSQSRGLGKSSATSGKATKIGTAAYKKPVGRPATLSPFTTPQIRRGYDPALAAAPQTEQQSLQNQPRTQSNQAGVSPALQQGLPPVDAADREIHGSAAYGKGIVLSLPVLCIILFTWVLSIALAYYMGPGPKAAVPLDPGAGRAAGVAGTGPSSTSVAAVDAPSGLSVLVLLSVKSSQNTADSLKQFQARADKLNQLAQAHPEKLVPYFGVRETSGGGLQLIFGLKDGQMGVLRGAYPEAESLIMSKKNFPDAYWLPM